jgi:hypothetical protein
VRLSLKTGFGARIIGGGVGGAAYGFQQLIRNDDLTFSDDPGGFSAPEDPASPDYRAFECNAVAGLDGTVQWLVPGAGDDFRFQDIAMDTRDPGPPYCPPTFCLKDCAGSPISGAQINFYLPEDVYTPEGLIPELSGVTGGDGCYTTPPIDAELYPSGVVPQIVHDGTTLNLGFAVQDDATNCTSTYRYCYDKATVIFNTTAEAEPAFDPLGPGDATGTLTTTIKRIRRCSSPGSLPATIEWRVYPTVPGFRDVCGTVTVGCNETAIVDATMYDFRPCYVDGYDVPGSGRCAGDLGCSYGKGPNFRGVLSRVMEVQFTSLDGLNRFADDEGEWIELNHYYVYHALFPTVPIADVWTSGCRGPKGNYVSNGPSGCLLNRTTPYQTSIRDYGSTNVNLECGSVAYNRFGEGDCTTNSECAGGGVAVGCGCSLTVDGKLCRGCQTSANLGFPDAVTGVSELQAPCDTTLTTYDTFGITPIWQVRIREKC